MHLTDEPDILPLRGPIALREEVGRRVTRAVRRRRIRRASVSSVLAALVLVPLLLTRVPDGETSLHTPASGGSADDVEAAEVPTGASPGSGGAAPSGLSATPTPTPTLVPPSVPNPLAEPTPPGGGTTTVLSEEYRLAVIRFYEAWELGRDGQPLRKLASPDVTEVEWAPDGRRLAYLRNTSTTVGWWYEIRILDTESMQDHLVVSGEHQMWGLSFSADGTLLAFGRSPSSTSTAPGYESTVAVIDLDSPNMSDQWEFGPGDMPSWLPDGRILFRCDGQLCIATARGANRVVVPNSKEAYRASASPDGHWITFGESNRVQVMRIDGTDRRTLSEGLGGPPSEWSPDSSRVFYWTDAGIRSVRRDGSDVRVVTEYNSEGPFAVGRR